MHYLKIYKICLKLKSLSFKIILNIYERIQSITPFTLKGHILLIFHYIVAFFTNLDTLGGGLQNCFKFQKEHTMDKRVIMIQYC
jgi:hypothetical protein